LVFSICSNNYLAQAITLGDSLREYAPDYKFVICLVDRKNKDIDYQSIRYDILAVERIGVPYFDEMIMRYNIVELNTAFKPYFFQHFFAITDADSVIYLDPDIQVFSPFSILENELKTNDIVITPHFTTPLNDDKWQAEEDFLNSGLYNLGFIAIKNSDNGRDLVKWWADRLRNKAYINYSKGLFTDQIWINFVPLFFPRVKILTDFGYNVAYWNLHERSISIANGRYMVNEHYPLVFYHYASFRPLNPTIISSGQKRFTFEERPDIVPLFQKYCELVFKNNYKSLVKYQCYYVEARENLEREQLLEKIRKVPFYKKVIGRIMREIIKRLNIVMDYNTLK
jgi:hypothetical protein